MNEEIEEFLSCLITMFAFIFGGIFILVLSMKWMIWLMDLFNLI